MADSVTTNVILDSPEFYIVHLTNVSDGTGEADVVKVDKSAIGVAMDGAEPASLDILRVEGNTNGMSVTIEWDHGTDDRALILNGEFKHDFSGSDWITGGVRTALKDPRSAGGTGDILLSTTGHTAADTYSITLWLRKTSS